MEHCTSYTVHCAGWHISLRPHHEIFFGQDRHLPLSCTLTMNNFQQILALLLTTIGFMKGGTLNTMFSEPQDYKIDVFILPFRTNL